MADESTPVTPNVTINLQESTPGEVSAPIDAWVKGGTSSSAYDKELAQKRFDIADRQKQSVQDVIEARNPGPGGVGDSFSHSFSGFDPTQRPVCHVKLVNRRKEDTGVEMLVDVTMDEQGKLMLTFVCPDCIERGVHQSFAQQTARDDHRAWFLDTNPKTGAGMPFQVINAWGHVETHISAGEIMDTDTLRCSNPHCTFACKIHKNLMYRV